MTVDIASTINDRATLLRAAASANEAGVPLDIEALVSDVRSGLTLVSLMTEGALSEEIDEASEALAFVLTTSDDPSPYLRDCARDIVEALIKSGLV